MVNKPIYLVASFLAILGIIAVASSGNHSVFAQEEAKVSIVAGASTLVDKAYSPNPIEVKVGQKVEWTNDDTVMHTVTSGAAGSPDSGKAFDSGFSGPTSLSAKGKTFEHTFDKAGEYVYYCQLHPTMAGKVIVK